MNAQGDDSLLEQAERALISPADPGRLLSVAVACHRRMLELGEAELLEAARHALAGAALIEALQTTPLELPPWLPAHEEQCCRYGAIWIHQLIQQGDQQAIQWSGRALRLLSRMQQLHDQPIAWAVNMGMDLKRHLPCTGTCEGLRLVLVGNCQSYPLMLGLQQSLPQVDIHFCPPVHLANEQDVAHLHSCLSQAHVLVAQRVQPGYRDNIGLDTATLRQLMPAGSKVVVVPNLHYEGCHPWLGYARDQDGMLAETEAESPLGAYHDFLAMAAAEQGMAVEQLLDSAPSDALLDELLDAHHHSLQQLRQREADCNIGLADWIEQNHQHLALTHTINHPTQAALDQLLRQLLAHLGLPHQLDSELFDAREHLGEISVPIHPWVREALGLHSWSSRWGQRRGMPLPIEQQLIESLAFYQRHPWIAAANASHPKLQLAQRCLKMSRVPRRPAPAQGCVEVLHLHGFKCAGSTFIWSLEHACGGAVAYVESPEVNQRLAWEHVEKHLCSINPWPRAITSHLITLPPPGAVAKLKVAFLRDPLARISSAFRFQRYVQKSIGEMSFHDYLVKVCKGPLANYQTRHLSPQLQDDWAQTLGWAARPEALDLRRSDLLVGLVERYDESIIVLEHQLEQLGIPMDLSYPQAFNTTSQFSESFSSTVHPLSSIIELDTTLYQLASEVLDERLSAIIDLAERRDDFQRRCRQLRDFPIPVRIKPSNEWTLLPPQQSI